MKKSLSKAVALAATLGAAASAHAVNVNQHGLGQVLLYPIYTAEEGNFTAVHVTNTTNQVKAVKVRFVEGMNSQEVLDFNLYLSPNDVWTGGVVQTEDGAKLVTSDKSCTAGSVPEAGLPFQTILFDGTFGDSQKDSIISGSRTRVGHLEVIEMGVVSNTSTNGGLASAATHNPATGVPANCEALRSAWNPGGVWVADATDGVTAPTGGLYGTATVVNVNKGTEFGVEVTALDNFTALAAGAPSDLHVEPGDEAPSLADAQITASFPNGASRNFLLGIDAVSAALMKENIVNDYAYGAGLNAQTDLIVTFPTKSQYVNVLPVRAPFTAAWNRAVSKACETISVNYFNREEGTQQLSVGQISPRPPTPGIALCYETNVFSIGQSRVVGGEFVRTQLNLNNGFQTGWINIGLTGTGRTLTSLAPAATLNGLPVIGFAATQIENGDVGGLLSNYAGAYTHKGRATVVAP